ncbi:glutathione S-transferase family protein [Agrobacterium vitis]|uniref:Glutathione S-transferase family protein n=1 Tax=Agrobacterium vitis TaxID=373 RepID=A0A368NZ88_AGRVI|nr:glutathione S-transferase family protein [Agrobacterium vitis]KAA3518422.1 glutathione S-transferase family protein [Agrobacterium vitis]KAA3530019.1 glutathione S-transferase family protein [Agrobacterium vitis]MCF1476625.1 glutathione S-transferase family protein [Agrobacterium vitis]MUZ96179.1 glutathione S-transferase family protein [Agrobacterium vitis]MVA29288.1 glutathione S-transferase family protein [Agrobacterium vitis]
MSAITLYNYDLDENCYRVRLLLSCLGLAYETHAIDMVPGREEQTPGMLALNPLGELPVLKDGEQVLYGTQAILAHLARAYDPSGTWLPLDPAIFGGVMQWTLFSVTPLGSAVTARRVALFGGPGDAEALKASSRAAFRIMDDHMTLRQFNGYEWFAGAGPTIADLALFPSFALSRDYGIDHDEFPALRRWQRRFRTVAGFRTMPGIPDYH